MESPETATTVRVEKGETLTTDGPFVAVKEALGGYLFFEAGHLDPAIELAARIPAARLGGAVEIRPVKEGYWRSSSRSSARSGAASSRRWAEAFAAAAERWPRDGTPACPRAWLVTTARNRAIDRIRRDRTLAAKTTARGAGGDRGRDGRGDDSRRAAGADLHLLPPRARARRAGRAHAAGAGRPDHERLPDEPEVHGLLALMLLHARARRPRPLRAAGRHRLPPPRRAPALAELAALYGELARRTGSSVVELNQAAALAEAGDVEAALDRTDDARAAYERALALVHSEAERRFLAQRLAELEG
jgi:predicted RNA polymerase sigma factor